MLVLAATLANCGSESKSSEPSMRKIRVANSAIAPETLTISYGVKAGIFQRHGLDVDVQAVANAAVATAAIVSGDIQVAQVASPTPQNAIIQGADVQFVATAIRRPLFTLVGRPGIASVQDLVGKAIAAGSPGSPLEMFVAQMLRAADVDPSDVEIRAVGGPNERIAALVAGQVDAAIITLPALPKALQASGGTVLADQSKSDKPWPFLGLAVTGEFAAKNEKLLTDFLRAYAESIAQFKTDSAGAQPVIAAETKTTDPETIASSYKAVVDLLDSRPVPNAAEAQAVLDMLSLTEPKAKDFPVERLFNATYIESALKSSG